MHDQTQIPIEQNAFDHTHQQYMKKEKYFAMKIGLKISKQ